MNFWLLITLVSLTSHEPGLLKPVTKRNHIRQAKRHFEQIYNDSYLFLEAAAEPEVMLPAADPLRLLFPPRAQCA